MGMRAVMLLDLVRASDAANEILLHTLEEANERRIIPAISPSHGSIPGLLHHMLAVEAFFLNTAQGRASEFSKVETQDLHELKNRWKRLSQRRFEYLSGISTSILQEEIPVDLGRGQIVLPRYQLIIQSVTHSIHHRGELSILLSNLGHPLPTMDSILYFVEVSGQTWPSM